MHLLIPLGNLTDLSTNEKVMEVNFRSPSPNWLYTEYGRRFTLVPKSKNVIFLKCYQYSSR